MTGPEHYKRAEQLVDSVDEAMTGDTETAPHNMDLVNAALAAAQVHATLAMAASQVVDDVADEAERNAIKREWNRAIA